MFSSKLTKIVFIGALSASMGGTALAATTTAPLGTPAAETFTERTINLLPDTKYVNVEQGEIVKFSKGGKTFSWSFDTQGTPNFNLNEIAPKGAMVDNVRVYVGPNSLYFGS